MEKENAIVLQKRNTLKFEIYTDEGEDTGECLEFDMDDIELRLKLNKSAAIHSKNLEWLKGQLVILGKKEDKKGKYLLSYKEEEEQRIINEFYKKEMYALDLFLGKNATKKLLNGKSPYYEMYDDISKSLEPILPKLELSAENIIDKIKKKYSSKEEDNILE